MRLAAVESANLAADVMRVENMAEAILSAPALAAATKVQVDDERPKKVTATTRSEMAATGRDSMIEYFDHPNPKRGAWVQLNLDEREISLNSVVERGEITKYRATALDDLTAAFVQAAEVWRGVGVVREGWIKFEYVDTSPAYARLRKPRESRFFPQRSLVTFLDPGWAPRADEVRALTEPPPAHATKRGRSR
jgi:hypothetical protein